MNARSFVSASLAGALLLSSLPALAETPPAALPPPPPPSAPPAPGSYPQAPPWAYPQAPGSYPQAPPGSYPQVPGAYPQVPPGAYPQVPGAYPPAPVQGYYYPPAPPPGYWQGYEPPVLERRSTGAMIAGIVLVAAGGAGLLVGTSMSISARRVCDEFGSCTKQDTPGLVVSVLGAVFLAGGIPALIYGAGHVPVKPGAPPPRAALPAWLGAPWVAAGDPRRGPVGGGMAWRF
jgi:hypothetical protein